MSYKDNLRKVGGLLSKEERERLEKILNEKSEEQVKEILTKKYPCKLCGQMLAPQEILEHALIKHNEKGAGEILDELNKFRGT